ncbi:unnamed protein product [Rotaria sp. Silwood1]|nr:unnamed protein product [Rotaria sp. Silwood1]
MASSIVMETSDNEFNSQQEEFQLLQNAIPQQTVTSLFACGHPLIRSPKDAIKFLFLKHYYHLRHDIERKILHHDVSQQELDAAAKFGRFSQRPSDLFLKLFYGVICTLQHNPLAGCVSPSLIGSTGVIPLTIISTIPDIMYHYYHVIVHAQKEILFATMYWENSESANIISKAFRDLSERAGYENRRVIIKLMMDHPTISNALYIHSIIPPNKWSFYGIPSPEEISNISLEVHNYHRIIMGTFHAKFLIVDRKLVLLNSNNVQDRPNLEMMSQFEGDIVNSFYDTFLISWSLPFQPNLVCLNDNVPTEQYFHFDIDSAAIASVKESSCEAIARVPSRFKNVELEKTEIYLDEPELSSFEDQDFSPIKDNKCNGGTLSVNVSQAANYSRALHLPNVLIKAANNTVDAAINYNTDSRSQSILTEHLNKSSKHVRFVTADKNMSSTEIEALSLEFNPFLFHRPHEPFPIALVNRLPQGIPIYRDTTNPQDAAWMGAFRYAQKSIFIQSPTLNASSAIDGIITACRRGIKVTLWLGLGFNDLREGPGTFQGGTNKHVVKKLYRELMKTNDGIEQNLETFWYTAKDQMRPLHFRQKKRNCHIKFMSIDGQVAIMGSANMDSLSWFHSQEINVMIDSPMIVKDWMDALYRDQATNAYGRLNSNGIWRNAHGQLNPKNGK